MMTSNLKRTLAAVAALVAVTVLAGCGGGGAGGQGGGGGPGGDSVPASIQLMTSQPTLGSDGTASATITAFVKDSANRALANQAVDFRTVDAGARLAVVSARTDATGTASATLSITDPTNRTVMVTADTGTLTTSVAIDVVGTTLTLNGPTNLLASTPTEYAVALRNSSGIPLAGRSVSVLAVSGGTLSANSVTTDAAGQAKFLFTGTSNDTLRVSALGASASLPLVVAAKQLSFGAPTANQEVDVSTPQAVTVTYLVGGVPQAGQLIEFFATRGTIAGGAVTPTSSNTDAAGQVTVSVSSPSAGPSTITALAGTVSALQRIEFVSRTAATLTLQGNPSVVGVNLTPSGTNSSQLIAVVRDSSGNPVKGKLVSFTALADPSNGRIEPALATTDSAGTAIVSFYPGANPTGNNMIVLEGRIPGGPSGQTTLTASEQALMVRIGTGNVVEALSPTALGYPWSAIVSDSAGNPVTDARIQAALVGTRFAKGRYMWNGTVWTPDPAFLSFCASEDNPPENLLLDPGEDRNGNGQLDPGNVAVVQVTSLNARTDSTGIATLRVNYPRSYAVWTEVRMRVTITTLAGTEGSAERTFWLPALASDLSDATNPPPGYFSPFGPGASALCTNTD